MFLDEWYGDLQGGVPSRGSHSPSITDATLLQCISMSARLAEGTLTTVATNNASKAVFSLCFSASASGKGWTPPLHRQHFCEPGKQTSQVLTHATSTTNIIAMTLLCTRKGHYSNHSKHMPYNADHSGRVVQGMNCLRSLELWDRGIESHSRHGCRRVRLFCVFAG
jgi:hypothetical protein